MIKETILSELEADSKIDINDLENESVKTPYLHTKWYKILLEENNGLKTLEVLKDCLYKQKYEFYIGRCDDEVYKNRPLNIKLTKAELDIYINADKEYCELKIRIEKKRSVIQLIEDFIKQINQRSFQIKNAIEFIKFKNGSN